MHNTKAFRQFAPVTKNPGWFWGQELGMDFDGMIYVIPSASHYVAAISSAVF